jgi:hypothetical protein
MANDPVTGPLTREQFAELVEMPFGEASKAIRKHDPLWGLKEGEKIDYEVVVSARVQGRAIVKASSLKEAEELAEEIGEHDCEWGGYGCDDLEVFDVRPAK